jgi:hypothetical protein
MPAQYPEFWGRDESRLWSKISGDHHDDYGRMRNDQEAVNLFSAGWLERGYTRHDREAIRDRFFDYLIEEGYDFDRDDFDWEAWRHAMGY